MSSENKIVQPDSLRTPVEQASINAMITAAVKEVFTAMAPMLQSIALTPDKLREANKPYIDPAAIAREARERAMMHEDLVEAERAKKALQDGCSHQDGNLRSTFVAVHNFPDRQARLLCMRCNKMCQPTHWEIAAPDREHPRGKPILVKADGDYPRLLAAIAQQQNTI